jgi:hypothetical protein
MEKPGFVYLVVIVLLYYINLYKLNKIINTYKPEKTMTKSLPGINWKEIYKGSPKRFPLRILKNWIFSLKRLPTPATNNCKILNTLAYCTSFLV